MNAIIIIILVFFAIIIGIFIGKQFFEQIKWSDKKKLIEQTWKSKIEGLEKDHEKKVMELNKNTELEIKKLTHESESKLKNLSHDWEVKYTKELKEVKEMIQSAEKYMRHDAVKRSRRVLLGKLWEQVSPYIPKFPFKPSDMKFMGAPIDFIVFDGMGEKDIKQVIFLEVKSGDSKLNAQEKKLKKIIEEKKVIWKQFNVDKPEKMKLQEEEEKEEIKEEITPHELYEHIEDKIKGTKSVENTNNEDLDETNYFCTCPSCEGVYYLTEEDLEWLKEGNKLEIDCENCENKYDIEEEDIEDDTNEE
jgi:predicted Holliday junction resolvase-like endonuclease